MMVIKKDGRVQDLNLNKLKTSILNAASDASAILNEADIKIVVSDVVKVIEKIRDKDGNTSSYELTGAIIDILKRDGFNTVVESFIGK
jgi:transcriptional regulator NrdR family protein